MSTPESTITCWNCDKIYDPVVYPYCSRCGEPQQEFEEGDINEEGDEYD